MRAASVAAVAAAALAALPAVAHAAPAPVTWCGHEGVDCGKSCKHAFRPGIHVRLTPSPAAGWRFGGWSGGCAGRRACSVGGEGEDVVARFVRR